MLLQLISCALFETTIKQKTTLQLGYFLTKYTVRTTTVYFKCAVLKESSRFNLDSITVYI